MSMLNTSPGPVHATVGRIPRLPGFRYGPKIVAVPYNGTYLFRVEQKGFWMHSSAVGPAKPTSAEAVQAWKRIFRSRFNPPNAKDQGADK
jgi:hypothetical protein